MPPTTTKLSDLAGGAYGVGASWAVSSTASPFSSLFFSFLSLSSSYRTSAGTEHSRLRTIDTDYDLTGVGFGLVLVVEREQSTGMNVNKATVKAGLARAGGETWEDILDYYNVRLPTFSLPPPHVLYRSLLRPLPFARPRALELTNIVPFVDFDEKTVPIRSRSSGAYRQAGEDSLLWVDLVSVDGARRGRKGRENRGGEEDGTELTTDAFGFAFARSS